MEILRLLNFDSSAFWTTKVILWIQNTYMHNEHVSMLIKAVGC